MEDESPLALLAAQIREAEAQRQAVEEELSRTPSWRFRQRARLQRRVERRRAKEREVMAFARAISKQPSSW
jgi:hypothetical protein